MTNRGFKLIKVPGDGNCGLYSILATLGIDYQFHQELRRLITDTMLDDIEILNLLAVNDKDDIRTQINMYIKKKKEKIKGLEVILMKLYFCPQIDWGVKNTLEILKWYCLMFYIKRP